MKFLIILFLVVFWFQPMDATIPVIIVAGQSNADGRVPTSDIPEFLLEDSDIKYLNVTSSVGDGFYYPDFTDANTKWGFSDVALHYIAKQFANDLYVIKCAMGGTAIDSLASDANRPTWCADEYYLQQNQPFRGNLQEGKSLVLSLQDGYRTFKERKGEDIEIIAVLWHQGETDRKAPDAYYDNFKQLLNWFDGCFNLSQNSIPFIYGTVSRKSIQYNNTVEVAQRKLNDEIEFVHLIDCSEMELFDNLHFNRMSSERFGKMCFNKLVELGIINAETIDIGGATGIINPRGELLTRVTPKTRYSLKGHWKSTGEKLFIEKGKIKIEKK